MMNEIKAGDKIVVTAEVRGLHGVPFDSLEHVDNFVACVKNVLPESSVTYISEPFIGTPYVLILVKEDDGIDTFPLIAEPGDQLCTNPAGNVWIKKPREDEDVE